ncbi:MAG: DUF177 domain-containing protein [Bacteroidia bacterium]|nr:DUF177 domain-containing protein [Bacteroidia bacterium]MCX7764522.1 DUF177 domain-containing protein [Bacteroidia bacterium]MDW8057989.1 hypothetical protein [Bacteroidia bacterium]
MRYTFFLSRLAFGENAWEWLVGRELFEAIGADYGIHDLSVRCQVRARKETRYLRLFLSLGGWVEVECDRGGELIRLPIEAQHEQIYSWDEYYLPPAEIEEFFTVGSRTDEIDLTQALYDYIGLAVPWRRVRPTCPDESCPAHVHAFLKQS